MVCMTVCMNVCVCVCVSQGHVVTNFHVIKGASEVCGQRDTHAHTYTHTDTHTDTQMQYQGYKWSAFFAPMRMCLCVWSHVWSHIVLQVKVTLLDQSSYTARVVGADPDKDVAVLQVCHCVTHTHTHTHTRVCVHVYALL